MPLVHQLTNDVIFYPVQRLQRRQKHIHAVCPPAILRGFNMTESETKPGSSSSSKEKAPSSSGEHCS